MPFPNVLSFNTDPTDNCEPASARVAQLAMAGTVELDLGSVSDKSANSLVRARVVAVEATSDGDMSDDLLALRLMQLGGFSNASVDAAKMVLAGDQAYAEIALRWAIHNNKEQNNG